MKSSLVLGLAALIGFLGLAGCGGPDGPASAQSACTEMHAINLMLAAGTKDLQTAVQEAQFNATQALVADEKNFQHLAVLINGFPKRVDTSNTNGANSNMKQIISECRSLGFGWQ